MERLRNALPLAPVGQSTYYQSGDAGYPTYPAYRYTALGAS